MTGVILDTRKGRPAADAALRSTLKKYIHVFKFDGALVLGAVIRAKWMDARHGVGRLQRT